MIKNEAIAIASEIIKAQENAKVALVNEGVFFCKNVKKKIYEIVAPENIVFRINDEDSRIGELLVKLFNDNENNKTIINSLLTELNNLKNNFTEFKAGVIDALGTVETMIEENEESGDPL